jgi:DNA-directed RNA polymerase subunit RPC12/RpoP
MLERNGLFMADNPQCPQCDSAMIIGPKPLKRIFGDVRAFECVPCEFTILLEFRPSAQITSIRRIDAAE